MAVDAPPVTRTHARVPSRAFVRYAWLTLGVTLLVIVWGAVVRATGSGAGCGSHWPLCNGDVVPLAPSTSTLIEFVHRVSSGGAMLLSLGLMVWARRVFPFGHQARRWAAIAFVFMLIEAAIGAGIVLLGLVEDNASALRAGYIGGHLVNTLLLVGAMVVTIWWGAPDGFVRLAPMIERGTLGLTIGLVALLAVAATGAVVALGDTLFPHASLAEGIAADFDATSHILIRLRIWHPVLAGLTAIWLLREAVVARGPSASSRGLLITFVVVQSLIGVVNLVLLAPLTIQMAHLLVSNLLWIAAVWGWLETRRARVEVGSR
jgi:cytochrome c oxidase assembly protein subunit 15